MKSKFFSSALMASVFTISPLWAMDQAPDDEGRGALVALHQDQWPTVLEYCPLKAITTLACTSKGMYFFIPPLAKEHIVPQIDPFHCSPILVTPDVCLRDLINESNPLFSDPLTIYQVTLGGLEQVMKNPMNQHSGSTESCFTLGNRKFVLIMKRGDQRTDLPLPDFGASNQTKYVNFLPHKKTKGFKASVMTMKRKGHKGVDFTDIVDDNVNPTNHWEDSYEFTRLIESTKKGCSVCFSFTIQPQDEPSTQH